MIEVRTAPWTEDEESAFNVALGKWAQATFTDMAKTGNSVSFALGTLDRLGMFWLAGREYERKKGK